MEIIFALNRIFKINGYSSLPFSTPDENSVCVLERTSSNSTIDCLIEVNALSETLKIIYRIDNHCITLVIAMGY